MPFSTVCSDTFYGQTKCLQADPKLAAERFRHIIFDFRYFFRENTERNGAEHAANVDISPLDWRAGVIML
jgi:hypothetical protein